MFHVVDCMTTASICPMALLCIFLLNDRWRVRPLFRWLLFALSGPLSIWLYSAFPAPPSSVRVLLPWLVLLLCCWGFSAIRDARFLFVSVTGMLFAYLNTSVSGSLYLIYGVPSFLICILLNLAVLALGIKFFRPAFLEVYHVLEKGWLIFSFMPLGLTVVFFSLLISPDYIARFDEFFVRGSLYLLAILTIVFYCASFYFFRKLARWQEGAVNSAVLGAQISAYTEQRQRRDDINERERILRHDLRHYLLMLSSCLREGDAPAAAQVLAALNSHIDSVETSTKREAATHDA